MSEVSYTEELSDDSLYQKKLCPPDCALRDDCPGKKVTIEDNGVHEECIRHRDHTRRLLQLRLRRRVRENPYAWKRVLA